MKTTPPWITSVSLAIFFLLVGCYETASEKAFARAQELLEQNKVSQAETEFKKIFDESPDKDIVLQSAKKLYEISFFKTKNYRQAVIYLNRIIANAGSFGEALDALKKKATIEHKHLLQYEAAISSYSRLLEHSGLTLDEESSFRLDMVKCLFAINKFEQAKSELRVLFEPTRSIETRLSAKNLEASVLQAEGNIDKAVESYNEALSFAITDKDKQDVLINIAMCYEQREQYQKALEALNKIKLMAPFLEEKRKQLERLAKFKDRRLNR